MGIEPATNKQLSYLRKLYYKSSMIPLESWDMFDEVHAKHIDRREASELIDWATDESKQKSEFSTESVKQTIENIEKRIGGENNESK